MPKSRPRCPTCGKFISETSKHECNLKVTGLKDEAIKLYQKGYSYKDIADALNIHRSSVARLFKKLGITARKPYELTKRCSLCGRILPKSGSHNCVAKIAPYKDKIIELYNEGYSQGAIAELLGMKQATVSAFFRKMGIKARSRGIRRRTIVIPSDERVIAYTAGLFDGEGWIIISKRKWGKNIIDAIQVGLANTSLPLINWLHSTFKAGYIYNGKSKLSKRFAYTWRLTRILDIYYFLKAITPYLVIKKERALEALKVAEKVIGCC